MPCTVSRLLLDCLTVLFSLSACQKETEAPHNGLAVQSANGYLVGAISQATINTEQEHWELTQ